MRILALAMCVLLVTRAFSQISGKVVLDHLGMEFTIPPGWAGQQTEAGYVLGSHSEPGLIILTSHESKTIEDLKSVASQDIYDEGIHLQTDGSIDVIDERTVEATYAGTFQGQAVNAHAAGLINPHGTGVTVLAIAAVGQFSDRHAQLVREIATSFRFYPSSRSEKLAEWKRTLTNARLSYLQSYSSGSGGYSNKIVIDLCAGGYFNDSRNYSMSIETDGAFGSDFDNSGGSGSWDVIAGINGSPILRLTYNDGVVKEYSLSYRNEKTFLNDTQYFRTYDAQCR